MSFKSLRTYLKRLLHKPKVDERLLVESINRMRNRTNMKRYKVVEGSESGHCCFTHSVVDTEEPIIINGRYQVIDGDKSYDEVAECFNKEDADLICDALNCQDVKIKAKKNAEQNRN